MNPPEGAAEEGGAADSDVDAFFRTGKLDRARAAGGEGGCCCCCLVAACRTSLGKEGCCRGVRVGGSAPSSSGQELPRLVLFRQSPPDLGRAWGAGNRRPSAIILVAGVFGGEAVPSSRLLASAGMGRCWITLLCAARATGVLAPPWLAAIHSLPPLPLRDCQQGLRSSGPATLFSGGPTPRDRLVAD